MRTVGERKIHEMQDNMRGLLNQQVPKVLINACSTLEGPPNYTLLSYKRKLYDYMNIILRK